MLTPRRKLCLEAIRRLTKKRGYSPTLQEIANALGRCKASTWEIVHALERDGYLTMASSKKKKRTRSIVLAVCCPYCKGTGLMVGRPI